MAKKKEMCPCCGQVLKKLNPHHMCRSKVWMLMLLDKARKCGQPWVRAAQKDYLEVAGQKHKVPYVALTHMNRLTWFGLAESAGRRTALYRITDAGIRFLEGTESVPETIWCRDGVVIRESSERSFFDDVKDVVLTKQYWDQYASVQVYA